jgi:hypothetical protein
MESSFHIHLNELEQRSAFASSLLSHDVETNTGDDWMGGLVHPSGPQRDSRTAQMIYAAIMTLCEATVHDQLDLFQSQLGKDGIKVISEHDEIGFRYADYYFGMKYAMTAIAGLPGWTLF